MPQDEHNEWPSFKTVLRDVATSEESPRPETHAPAQRDAATDVLQLASGDHIQLGTTETISESFLLDLLPEPLAPVDIDTSAIRTLLLPPTDSPVVEDFDLRGLEPLEPTVPEPDVVDPNPVFESASAFEPESVFDLAFEADADTPSSPFDGLDALYAPESDATPIDVSDDLNIASEISLNDVPKFTEDEHLSGAVDVDSADIAEVPSSAVFELDESTIAASEDTEHNAAVTSMCRQSTCSIFH